MEAFHFLRPWWLLGILAFLLLAPWLWRYLQQYSGWHKVLAPHLTSSLLGTQQRATGRLPFTLVTCAWLIACVAIAGPSWERLPATAYQNERAAVIIMDMSMNTRASDVTPDRLTRLRFKALDLIDALDATEVALIAYAGDAYTISPLTRDHANMRGMIPALSPEIMPVAGNDPLLAFQEAHRMVTDAGYQHAELYWFSAGVRQDDYQHLRNFLRGKGHRVSTLIAGDDQSTPIRRASGEMLRDSLGRLSMAQLNSSLFQRLSNEYGGRTVSLRADNSDIEYIIEQGAFNEQVEREGNTGSSDQWLDRGPYLAWLLLPLALFAARKGVLVAILLLPFASLLYLPPAAYANTTTNHERSFRPFSNQQQRAQEFYEQGAYQQAAELFQDPMMRANAYYKAEQFGAAADAYAQAEDSAERWFNNGNALAQLGELDAASDAYAQALTRRPDWQEAIENKAMVDELREQQESEDEQSQDQEDDTSSEQDDEQQGEQENPEQQDEQEQQDNEASQQDSTAQDSADEEAQGDAEQAEQEEEQSSMEQEQQIEDALQDDQLSDEERAELEQLLRRVQNDPAILLRNRMRLEAERRQQSQPPRGVRRP